MTHLKGLRENAGLTQKEVVAHLNCTIAAYSRYELGLREPDFETILKLADLFDVTIDYLLGRTDDPNGNYNTEDEASKVKFALFGEFEEIPENVMDEVKWFARQALAREREKQANKNEQ